MRPPEPPGSTPARIFLVAGAVLVALATIAGAFGSHALRSRLTASQLGTWSTAVEYQFFHALGLMIVGLIARQAPARLLHAAGWCILAGVVMFSGSLYALAGLEARVFGPITPIGGVLLIAGWVVCATNLSKVATR